MSRRKENYNFFLMHKFRDGIARARLLTLNARRLADVILVAETELTPIVASKDEEPSTFFVT